MIRSTWLLKLIVETNIDFFLDRAVSETTSKILNRLDSPICGDFSNFSNILCLINLLNFWECAIMHTSRWLEAPVWGFHQIPCQESPTISGWIVLHFSSQPQHFVMIANFQGENLGLEEFATKNSKESDHWGAGKLWSRCSIFFWRKCGDFRFCHSKSTSTVYHYSLSTFDEVW